jgi:hypothetical protein
MIDMYSVSAMTLRHDEEQCDDSCDWDNSKREINLEDHEYSMRSLTSLHYLHSDSNSDIVFGNNKSEELDTMNKVSKVLDRTRNTIEEDRDIKSSYPSLRLMYSMDNVLEDFESMDDSSSEEKGRYVTEV